MASGHHGLTGQSVITHVVNNLQFELEIVQIPNHNMVDILVMVLTVKLNHVQKTKMFHLVRHFAK